jgi:hypothetical protein
VYASLQGKGLVEPPIRRRPPDIKVHAQFTERLIAQINAIPRAAHTLIDNLSLDGLATLGNGNSLATERVAIGLRTHHAVWESDDGLGFPVMRLAAGAESGFVEGDVA